MVTIASIVFDALNKASRYSLELVESLQVALDTSKKAVLHESRAPIVGIRGPPGTGKTKIMEGAINDNDIIYNIQSNNLKFIYIAPTNELTRSGFERALVPVIRMFGGSAGELVDALRRVRVYGSAIPPPYLGQDLEKLSRYYPEIDKETWKKILRDIVYGGINDDVLFIFTTDYQRASARSRSSHKFLMFVDEASKSPFYLPFNPVSDSELKGLAMGHRSGVIHGLVVVGDDRQAIALGPEYQGYGKTLLVLPKVGEVLQALDLNEQFKTLTTTFRLPSPTEKPIGEGFYGDVGGLQAYEAALVRLRRKLGGLDLSERFSKCKNIMGNYLWDVTIELLEQAIGDLNKPQPIIIVNTSDEIPGGQQFEPCRVKLSVYFALALRCLSSDLGISVIAPYRELVDSARYYFRRLTRDIRIDASNVRFLTVQSMLGGEDDVVISMLGKEWTSREESTIYFREPENLNVQLSRHRLMLIVIGNATRLRNAAAKEAQLRGMSGNAALDVSRIRITLDTMLELAGVEISRKRPSGEKGIGEGAVFRKVNCSV